MKLIRINNCKECPHTFEHHRNPQEINEDASMCCHPDFNCESIEDSNKIPDWCLLEDAT